MDKRSGSPSEAEPVKMQRSTNSSYPGRIGFYFKSFCRLDSEFLIFALDTGGGVGVGVDVYPKTEPAVRIRGLGNQFLSSEMCVCNSILFMFEGRSWFSDGYPRWGRKVWKLDLSPYLQKGAQKLELDLGVEKDREKLTGVSDMNSMKSHPIPIPVSTAEGFKIIVFSEGVRSDSSDGDGDIELYDIKNDSWEKLPGLPPPINIRRPHVVRFCTLLQNSRFMIITGWEAFVIDLNSGKKQWKAAPRDRYDLNLDTRGDIFYVTIKDQYALGPGWIVDFGEEGLTEEGDDLGELCDVDDPYKLSSFDPSVQDHYLGNPPPAIILVHEADADLDLVCVTCNSQVQSVSSGPDCPPFRAIIDVCRIDLDKIKGDVVRTVRFSFDAVYYYVRHGLFLI